MRFSTSLFLMGKLGHLTWSIPLSVCSIFLCPDYDMGASVGFFNVYADVDACDSGLYRHHKRVCTGRWLGEKHPLLHLGLKPKSVLHLAFIQMLHQLHYPHRCCRFTCNGLTSTELVLFLIRVTPDAGSIYPVNTAGLSDDWSNDWWK